MINAFKGTLGVIAAIIFVCIIIFAIIAGTSEEISNNTLETQNQAEDSPQEEPTVVDMNVLISEFDDNQLAAEDKYEDMLITSSGFIDNISEDILGNSFVSINPNNEDFYFGTYVQCFAQSEESLLTLSNGQQITFTGRVEQQTLGIISIERCTFQ